MAWHKWPYTYIHLFTELLPTFVQYSNLAE